MSNATAKTHPKLQTHFHSMEQQLEASTLGMWVFLVTEVMFFGGLFMQIPAIAWLGILMVGAGTIFALVTLPVELNASNRAKIVDWLTRRGGDSPDVGMTDRTLSTAMIAVQGPHVTAGYWGAPEQTAARFEDAAHLLHVLVASPREVHDDLRRGGGLARHLHRPGHGVRPAHDRHRPGPGRGPGLATRYGWAGCRAPCAGPR